jgi:5'-3' exonuclease
MLKTLVVDGNSLLQTGFHGVKDFYHKGKHFGAIFHFLHTIKKHLEKFDHDKVVVFWDGKNNRSQRQEFYPSYKLKRKSRLNKSQTDDMFRQKHRITQYLEELFIRQGDFEGCEADDCIAYYCQNSTHEHKTIITTDKDLGQLISQKVNLYFPREDKLITFTDKIKIGGLRVPISNLIIVKTLLGDKSDNIKGISYFGEKSLLKYFPEIEEKDITLKTILRKTKEIVESGNKEKGIKNLNEGISSDGRSGTEFFSISEKLINLDNVFLPDTVKDEIITLINEGLDPEGRESEHILRMMMEDGMFKVLPQKEDGWTIFFKPLIKLKKKEIKFYNTKKV